MVFDYVKDIIIVKCAIELGFLVLYFLLCWCLDSSPSTRQQKQEDSRDLYSHLERAPIYLNSQIDGIYDNPSSATTTFQPYLGQHFCNQSCQKLIQTTKSVHPSKSNSKYSSHFENSTWVHSTFSVEAEKENSTDGGKTFSNCL